MERTDRQIVIPASKREWLHWFAIYAIAVPITAGSEGKLWWQVLIPVLFVWLYAALGVTILARWSGTMRVAWLAVMLNVGGLAVVISWARNWLSGGFVIWLITFAFLAGGALVALLVKHKSCHVVPLSHVDLIVATWGSIAYLILRWRYPGSAPLQVLVAHAALLTREILRNSQVEMVAEGPVDRGQHAEYTYWVCPRETKGWRSVLAAASVPSGVLGVIAICIDVGYLLVV